MKTKRKGVTEGWRIEKEVKGDQSEARERCKKYVEQRSGRREENRGEGMVGESRTEGGQGTGCGAASHLGPQTRYPKRLVKRTSRGNNWAD